MKKQLSGPRLIRPRPLSRHRLPAAKNFAPVKNPPPEAKGKPPEIKPARKRRQALAEHEHETS
jgi:hypothetical protein